MLCSVYSVALLVSAFSFGVYTPLEVISDISLNYGVLRIMFCIVYSVLCCMYMRILYRVLRNTVSCKVANLLETNYSTYNASMIFTDRHRSSICVQ